MLYCKECKEKYNLPNTRNFLYDETCECCGKPITTCFWNDSAEWLPELVELKEEELWDADPNCIHDIIEKWSGIKCRKCGGWKCL